MKIFSFIILLIINQCLTGQTDAIVFSSEYDDISVFIESLEDGNFFTVWKEAKESADIYSLIKFDINGNILESQELPSLGDYKIQFITSCLVDNGSIYIYGTCSNLTETSFNGFIHKYSNNLDFENSAVIGEGGLAEYVRDLIIVDNHVLYMSGFDYAYFPRAFLYKMDLEFNLIDYNYIDTAGGFSTAKLAMDYNSNQLIMFMHFKKAYFVDTSTLNINSTYYFEDIDGLSLREVLPVTENEMYIFPVLNPSGNADDFDDLGIYFKDKNFNTLNYNLFSIDSLNLLQAKNTLHYIDPDNIWFSYTTFGGVLLPEDELANHLIGVVKFNEDGLVLSETFIGGDANYVSYATHALEDGGALILTQRFDWESPEGDRDIYIFRVDADGDVILDVEDSPIQQFDFLVYPNPVSDYLIIKSQLIQSAFVEVYNMNGQLVNRTEKLSTELKIDLSQLSAGIYTYRIFTDNGVMQSGKFVKN